MKGRLRDKILLAVGGLLIVAGVGPFVDGIWQGANAQPLSVPITLKTGQNTSPSFRTYLSGDYQVELTWMRGFPDPEAYLDLDWKIVDDNGAVIKQGTYSGKLRGANDVILGYYRAHFGQRQRIIMTIHRDVEGHSASAELGIGQLEIGLDLSFGIPILLGWAVLVAGSGMILLCVLAVRRARRQNASTTPA
jgi:hypothetical protein